MTSERGEWTAAGARVSFDRPNRIHGIRRGPGILRLVEIAVIVAGSVLAASLLAPALRAEPHRVEVVGTYPIREALRGKVNPRDEAIQKALWEGVSRVALELIGEEGTPVEDESADATPMGGRAGAAAERTGQTGAGKGVVDPASDPGVVKPDPSERFRKVFGRQILPYTRSFRIVEDRGERPVLFAEEPGVRSEYLVVVEVIVDVDRVRGELARAGLIEVSPVPRVRQTVLIELVGLERYAGLRLALDTLRRALSASRIETLEFAPRRQLLELEGPFGPDEIAARLGRLDSAELILDPVEVDPAGHRLRVLAQYFEPVTDPAPEGLPSNAGRSPVTASPDAAQPIRP
ncbi:hypothetical protein K2X89_16275 [Myxococcota bacterium]|nr:hypothetical protein [Myxococcota bacterium]